MSRAGTCGTGGDVGAKQWTCIPRMIELGCKRWCCCVVALTYTVELFPRRLRFQVSAGDDCLSMVWFALLRPLVLIRRGTVLLLVVCPMVVDVRRFGGNLALVDLRSRSLEVGLVIFILLLMGFVALSVAPNNPLLILARSLGVAMRNLSCISGVCAVVSG